MYVVTVTQNSWDMLATSPVRNSYNVRQKNTYIPDPIQIRTLRIGDFAAQVENDPGRLIPGTVAEGDQRKILHSVVGSDFFLGISGKF